jgi:myo-inositol-1(or 4)-monophosphatase
MIREAGGRVTDLDGGERFFTSGNIVAGGVPVQNDLLAVVMRHASEAAIDHLNPIAAPVEDPVAR